MANNRVEVFVPNVDANGNFVDSTQLVSSIQGVAIGNITIQYESINIFTGQTFDGQGSMLLWAIADANLSSAQTAYNTFQNSHTWNVTPHFLVSVLSALG